MSSPVGKFLVANVPGILTGSFSEAEHGADCRLRLLRGPGAMPIEVLVNFRDFIMELPPRSFGVFGAQRLGDESLVDAGYDGGGNAHMHVRGTIPHHKAAWHFHLVQSV